MLLSCHFPQGTLFAHRTFEDSTVSTPIELGEMRHVSIEAKPIGPQGQPKMLYGSGLFPIGIQYPQQKHILVVKARTLNLEKSACAFAFSGLSGNLADRHLKITFEIIAQDVPGGKKGTFCIPWCVFRAQALRTGPFAAQADVDGTAWWSIPD